MRALFNGDISLSPNDPAIMWSADPAGFLLAVCFHLFLALSAALVCREVLRPRAEGSRRRY